MSKSSPKIKSAEIARIKKLFADGLSEAAHNPKKYWAAENARYKKIKPHPLLVKNDSDDNDNED